MELISSILRLQEQCHQTPKKEFVIQKLLMKKLEINKKFEDYFCLCGKKFYEDKESFFITHEKWWSKTVSKFKMIFDFIFIRQIHHRKNTEKIERKKE